MNFYCVGHIIVAAQVFLGADADAYRKLERAAMHLNDPNWRKTKEEKENDNKSAFAEIKMYVRNAITEGKNQIKFQTSEDDLNILSEIEVTLHKHDFYDQKKLQEMMEIVDDIFREKGLEAR